MQNTTQPAGAGIPDHLPEIDPPTAGMDKAAVLAVHAPAVCDRDIRTMDFHTKSYSYEFACRCCGKRRRMNTNYLGNRRVLLCDGKAIKPSASLEWEDWRALLDGKVQPNECAALARVQEGAK